MPSERNFLENVAIDDVFDALRIFAGDSAFRFDAQRDFGAKYRNMTLVAGHHRNVADGFCDGDQTGCRNVGHLVVIRFEHRRAGDVFGRSVAERRHDGDLLGRLGQQCDANRGSPESTSRSVRFPVP